MASSCKSGDRGYGPGLLEILCSLGLAVPHSGCQFAHQAAKLIPEVSKCMRVSGGERWGSLVPQDLTSVWLQPNTRASADGRRQQKSQTRTPRVPRRDRRLPWTDVTGARRRGPPVPEAAAVQKVPPGKGKRRPNRRSNSIRVSLMLSFQQTTFCHPPSHFTLTPHRKPGDTSPAPSAQC